MVDDLYQEIILDHSKRPRNFHPMEGANREAESTDAPGRGGLPRSSVEAG